jgi:hypothetical protein
MTVGKLTSKCVLPHRQFIICNLFVSHGVNRVLPHRQFIIDVE